jgi:hypothetical protein
MFVNNITEPWLIVAGVATKIREGSVLEEQNIIFVL